jgi:hypothetical protein
VLLLSPAGPSGSQEKLSQFLLSDSCKRSRTSSLNRSNGREVWVLLAIIKLSGIIRVYCGEHERRQPRSATTRVVPKFEPCSAASLISIAASMKSFKLSLGDSLINVRGTPSNSRKPTGITSSTQS